MATLDVKNKDGNDSGDAQNAKITVKANRNTHIHQDPPGGVITYDVDLFDQNTDGTILKDRLDDPRYYNGDAVT